MKEFNNIEELRENKELQSMGRYQWQKVKVKDEEVFACTTDQQYEDIIWGNTYDMLEQLFKHFNIDIDNEDKDFLLTDISSHVRDLVLEELEEEGIKFVDVFEEY